MSADIGQAAVRALWYRGDRLYGRVELISGPSRWRPLSQITPEALVIVDLGIFPWTGLDQVRGWLLPNLGNIQIDGGPPRRILSVRIRRRRAFLVVSREYMVAHDAHPAGVSQWCSNSDRCAWARPRLPARHSPA